MYTKPPSWPCPFLSYSCTSFTSFLTKTYSVSSVLNPWLSVTFRLSSISSVTQAQPSAPAYFDAILFPNRSHVLPGLKAKSLTLSLLQSQQQMLHVLSTWLDGFFYWLPPWHLACPFRPSSSGIISREPIYGPFNIFSEFDMSPWATEAHCCCCCRRPVVSDSVRGPP